MELLIFEEIPGVIFEKSGIYKTSLEDFLGEFLNEFIEESLAIDTYVFRNSVGFQNSKIKHFSHPNFSKNCAECSTRYSHSESRNSSRNFIRSCIINCFIHSSRSSFKRFPDMASWILWSIPLGISPETHLKIFAEISPSIPPWTTFHILQKNCQEIASEIFTVTLHDFLYRMEVFLHEFLLFFPWIPFQIFQTIPLVTPSWFQQVNF